MNPRAIAIFAKAPVPGQVKTRLIGTLTPTQAAAIHARLTMETIRLVSGKDALGLGQGGRLSGRREPVPGGTTADSNPLSWRTLIGPTHSAGKHKVRMDMTRERLAAVYLYCHPDTSHPFFQTLSRRFPVTLRSQRGSDLGQRMANALEECLSRHRQVVLLGCDCPSLTRTNIHTAFQSLARECDVVLGPAEDGGYVLMATTRPLPFLFRDMAWGSSDVLETTVERLRQQQVPFELLPMQWDLDRPCDLERYRRLANTSSGGGC